MAFPVLQASDTTSAAVSASSASWTLTYPTNVQAGDLLLLVAAAGLNISVSSLPSGWVSGGQQGTRSVVLSKKLADGSETGTFTLTLNAPSVGTWRVYRVTGWAGTLGSVFANDGSSGDVVVVSTTGAGAPTADPPNIIPFNWVSADTLWLAAVGYNTFSGLTSYPANFPDNQSTEASTNTGLGVATLSATASSEDPSTFGFDSNVTYAAASIAVRPLQVVVPVAPSQPSLAFM